MVYLIIIIFVLPSILGSLYYIYKKRIVFSKPKKTIYEGLNKYLVHTQKHNKYVQSIKGENFLYYSLIIGSSGSSTKLFDSFPEDNEFKLSIGNEIILMSSSNMNIDVKEKFLTFAVVPFLTEQLFLRKPTKEEYLEYYKKYSVVGNPVRRAYSYYEKFISENQEYVLIANFINGKIDESKKVLLSDSDFTLKREVLTTAFIIAIPAIIVLAIINKI